MTLTLQDLKPSQIKPHKNNPRRDVGDVAELAASITEQGILEPLIVAPNGTPDQYVLIAGHRRLAAARQAKAKTVPCIVRDDLTDPAAQIEAMLVENLQRADLTPVEEAQAYQQLLEFPGYTQTKVAKAVGRNLATVRGRLKLAALPKPTLNRIHEGQISLTEATALVEFADDKVTYKKLEGTAGTDNFLRELKAAKDRKALERKVAAARKKLTDAGVRIIDKAPGYNESTGFQRLFGVAIDGHRECPGFCAAVSGYSSSWSEPRADVTYYCDQPALHSDADDARDAAAEAARAELDRLAAEGTAARRAHLAGVIDNADADLAVTLLRSYVMKRAGITLWLADVLDYPPKDKVIREQRIAELDVNQLAVVVDLIQQDYAESSLERSYNWDSRANYGTGDWRHRLVELYGYEWSAAELKLLEKNEEVEESGKSRFAADIVDVDLPEFDEDDDAPEAATA